MSNQSSFLCCCLFNSFFVD